MQKLLLFTLMLLLVPLHATAQDNLEQKLIVTMKDGTKAEFNLNSEPSIYTSIIDMTRASYLSRFMMTSMVTVYDDFPSMAVSRML